LRQEIKSIDTLLRRIIAVDFEKGNMPPAQGFQDIAYDEASPMHNSLAKGAVAVADAAFKRITGYEPPSAPGGERWIDGYWANVENSGYAKTPAGFAMAATIDGILMYLSLSHDYHHHDVTISPDPDAVNAYLHYRVEFMISILGDIHDKADPELQDQIERFIVELLSIPDVNIYTALHEPELTDRVLELMKTLGAGAESDQIQERWLKIAGLLRG